MNKYVIIFYKTENGKNLYVGHAIVTNEFKAKQVSASMPNVLVEEYKNFSQWQANIDILGTKKEFCVFYNKDFKIYFKDNKGLDMFTKAMQISTINENIILNINLPDMTISSVPFEVEFNNLPLSNGHYPNMENGDIDA